MKANIGKIFSVAADNAPVPGCTVSKEIATAGGNAITCFSLAEQTDISAEIYPYHKFIIVAAGNLEVYATNGSAWKLKEYESFITPVDIPVGMRTETGTVYTEITMGRTEKMNRAVKIGEVFKLAELLPYQDGKIINMDVVHNEKMKFVVMSFDAGTGLSEHAAPGEALIFALDGEGVIGYEGKEHIIHAGENFVFAKGGAHWVKAEKRFKMALLLTLE
ncbi:MAG: cupin domain-containing protein [Lentisphaeria bacterium]|nr:cupin domain-containing protein [Lentisphaeria bacterium]